MNWKRLLSLVLCMAMLLSMVPVGILSISAASPLDVTTRYGRTYEQDGTLYLFWVNSGFSFRINGTGATATLTASSTAAIYQGYLNVYVDGEFVPSKTICLEQTTGTYTLAEGLPAGEHTIEVRKRNEGGYDGTAIIGVQALNAIGGDFLTPPAAPTRQIEFIGDSITTGFGNLGDADDGYSTAISDGTMTYAVLAAKQLGVEAQVLSRSGIHYGHSQLANGNYVDSFYDHYANTATLPRIVGSDTAWDFNADPSDVVVINLGTNDAGAGRDGATYTSDAVDFINLVRSKNPNATIIWTYGMMGNPIQAYLQAAVEQVNAAGDNNVFYLPLANLNQATEGIAVGHPTVQTDINRSRVLAEFIAEKTGWTVNNKAMLQAQLQWSAQYNNDTYLADYTAISKKNFVDAYESGEALLTSNTATNDEYVAAAEAIWMAKVNLLATADVSAEYIVIDEYDDTNGVGFGEGAGLLDTADYKSGEGCLSVSGATGLACINRGNYNVTLPENWQEWYLDFWLYVDDPAKITDGSCIEISQVVDNIEIQWGLNGLGLQPGWNKVQLPLTSGGADFTTLQNIRLFAVNLALTDPLVMKIDRLTLSKGKAAADIGAWETALDRAERILASRENAALRTAYENARTAVSQADVDAFTARLNAVLETVDDAAVTIIFDDPIYTSGGIALAPVDTGDSRWTLTTVDGYSVLNLDYYAYFTITNQDVLSADALTMEITYYDNTTSNMSVQYVSTGADYTGKNVERYASGELVTTTIALADADFDRATQNVGARFRISGGGNIRSITIRLGVTDDTQQAPPAFAAQTTSNNLVGKGVAGYQAWFRAGDEDNEWGHWGGNGSANPAPNQLSFEIYPSVDDYLENGATLYPSKLGDLGNGQDSLLFNSTDEEIIETHFQWMKEYDLDGAAVQRFYANTSTAKTTAKNHLQTIKEKAEKYDRLFYVMYDFSGCEGHDANTFLNNVKLDFIYNVEDKGVASSNAYAHADGKPVVCFWGISGEPGSGYINGTTAISLIEWFQNRGYYVIVGTPDNEYKYRTGTSLTPFTMADMISPWTVGRYGMNEYEGWLNYHVEADLNFCNQYGSEYQPVVFSGFGWTNMGNNGGINAFPHYAGQFLWAQAYKLKSMGASNIYFAMFDEYDEGTAHMKGATDYFEIPTDQYFLTYAADGWWLSNDYYLRAAGAVIDMMQGKTELRANIDIPHSQGPVYWRNSFESRETTYVDNGVVKTGIGQLDVCLNNPALLSASAATLAGNAISTTRAKSGQSSFRLNGNATADGTAFYKIADVKVPVVDSMTLTYSLYAENENGREVFVDLLFSDGTYLSTVNNNVTVAHGTVGEWAEMTVDVGRAAVGKSITGVVVGYEGGTGDFDAYVDDIALTTLYTETEVELEMEKVSSDIAFVDFTDGTYANLGSFPFGDDPTSGTTVLVDGTTMAKFSDFLYINVHDSYLAAKDNNVKIRITYLDNTTGNAIKLQYNSNDPNAFPAQSYTDYAIITGTGAGELRTVEIDLTDASFRNAQNGGCDLRISCQTGANLYVARVEIINVDESDKTVEMKEVEGDTAFVDYSNGTYANLDNFAFGDDPTSGKTVQVGDLTMAKFSQYLYLAVKDSYAGASDNELMVRITYLDKTTGNPIKMQYNSNDPDALPNQNYTDYLVAGTGDGELRTVDILLSDASFRNAQNGASDLRVGCNNGGTLYVTRVEIVNSNTPTIVPSWCKAYHVDYSMTWTLSTAALFAEAVAEGNEILTGTYTGDYGTLVVGETSTTYTPNGLMNGEEVFTFAFGSRLQTLTLSPAASVYYEAGILLGFTGITSNGTWQSLTTGQFLTSVLENANAVANDPYASQYQVDAATSSLLALTDGGNTNFAAGINPATADYRGAEVQMDGIKQTWLNGNETANIVEVDGQNAMHISEGGYRIGFTVDPDIVSEDTRDVTVYLECKITADNWNTRMLMSYASYNDGAVAGKETPMQYGAGHTLNPAGGGYTIGEWNILTFRVSDAYFLHNGENGRHYDSDFLFGFWTGGGEAPQLLIRRIAVVPTEQVSDAVEAQAYFDFVNKVENNPCIDGYGKDYDASGLNYSFNGTEGKGSIEENGVVMTDGPLYFQVADLDSFGAEVQVKVYTGEFNANVDMQYNSSDETQVNPFYKSALPGRIVSDGVVTFTMTDAAFTNQQNAASSFRVYANGAVITRVEVIAKDSADKTALLEAIENVEEIEAVDVNLTLGDPSDKYGQGGNDALENNAAFGFGDILEGVGSAEGTTLSIPFTGTGIDLYAMIDGTAGEIRVLLKDGTGKLIAARYIDAGFDYSTLYQTPVAQFKDLAYGNYTVELYVYPAGNKFTGDRCTLYLDGVRVYQPLGDVSYGDEGNVQFISLRDILLEESDLTDNVTSTGVAFVANDEYKEYGPKAEVYLAAGQSLTFHVTGEYTGIQIGLHAANGVTSQVLVNGTTVAVNSTMDMYYHITKAADDVYVITNSGTSDTLISLTKLKLTGVSGTVSLDVTEQALSAATAQVEQWQTEKLETQNAAEAARQQLIQLLETKVSAYV